jgi:aspartyl aminopeptidase
MEKKSKNQELQEKLSHKRTSAWITLKKEKSKIQKFSKDYIDFIGKSKTERLCVNNVQKILLKRGFEEISNFKKLKVGDKIFKNFNDKSLMVAVIGEDQLNLRIIGSHVDSPRLDLKPHPLYEDSGFGMLQTHYYGGVKKYHWVNIPLQLFGVIFNKKGKKIEFKGEETFIIPDLLPHLASKQMDKKAKVVVEAEELNVILANIPIDDKNLKDQVKFAILKSLNERYDISELDFTTAELSLVPTSMPQEIGFDKSMIAAYGQDDKVCVYTSLQALIDSKSNKNTNICMFVDKEEIGSMGNNGAQSLILRNFVSELVFLMGKSEDPNLVLSRAKSMSADVTAALNPNYKDVNDPQNVSYFGHGVSVEKYGGGHGKYSTNDASAEFMSEIRQILEKANVPWQTGELGKIEIGGGGTIAMFMSRYGMECLDVGPCILGMHSTNEVVSKVDVYCAYLAYKAFFN